MFSGLGQAVRALVACGGEDQEEMGQINS